MENHYSRSVLESSEFAKGSVRCGNDAGLLLRNLNQVTSTKMGIYIYI